MSSANIVTVSSANFEQEVTKSTVPVVLDFWAEWCGPCRALGPELDKLADETVGKLKVAKVDVEANPDLATKFRVMAIPALLVFKGGQQVGQVRGRSSKDLQKDLATFMN